MAENEMCITECISPDCHRDIYFSKELELGEADEVRGVQFESCAKESMRREVAEKRQAAKELLEMTDCGKASAIVSHLQVTRSMLSDAMGIPTGEMSLLKVATASVTCIDYDATTGTQTVHYQSFKPDAGLEISKDGAN